MIYSIFSSLPNELVHHILKIALASDSSTQTCLLLCLVSSWTRSLALPYLCSTVVINGDPQPLVDGTTFDFKWNLYPQVRKGLVRNLWCPSRKDSASVIVEFIRACPRIVNLSISGEIFRMIIKKMVCGPMITFSDKDDDNIDVAFFNRSRESIFGGITCTPRQIHFHPDSRKDHFHSLILFMSVQSSSIRDWTMFAAPFLSEITHVFLSRIVYTSQNFHQLSDLQPILHLPTLKMFVLAIAMDRDTRDARSSAETWVRDSRLHTSKLFLLPYETDMDAVRIQWEEDVRGGGSIWERAVQYTMAWETTREDV
jgi:hypothetical protein